jgi:hypothetical protein
MKRNAGMRAVLRPAAKKPRGKIKMGNQVSKRVRKGIAKHNHETARLAKKAAAGAQPAQGEAQGKK